MLGREQGRWTFIYCSITFCSPLTESSRSGNFFSIERDMAIEA